LSNELPRDPDNRSGKPAGLVRWLAVGLAATIASAAPASTQRTDSLPIGARVRVHFLHPPPAAFDGVLVATDSFSLTLTTSDGSPRVAPFDEVARLEQYVGQLSGGMGFKRGARTGMMVGIGTTAFLVVYGFMCGEACLIRTPAGAAAVAFRSLGLLRRWVGLSGRSDASFGSLFRTRDVRNSCSVPESGQVVVGDTNFKGSEPLVSDHQGHPRRGGDASRTEGSTA
jgi:hypothetical protein